MLQDGAMCRTVFCVCVSTFFAALPVCCRVLQFVAVWCLCYVYVYYIRSNASGVLQGVAGWCIVGQCGAMCCVCVTNAPRCLILYGVATISRLLKMTGLLQKRPIKETIFLQKRPIILRSLLIVATPYHPYIAPYCPTLHRPATHWYTTVATHTHITLQHIAPRCHTLHVAVCCVCVLLRSLQRFWSVAVCCRVLPCVAVSHYIRCNTSAV